MKELNSTTDLSLIKEIDSKVKNKFRPEWLEQSYTIKTKKGDVKVVLRESIVKVDIAGKVLCKYCNDVINYSSKGKSAIFDHLKSSKHVGEIEHRKSNYSLSAEFSAGNKKPAALFPLFNNMKKTTTQTSSPVVEQKRVVPRCDRKANMEAMIVAHMAEHNIAFNETSPFMEILQAVADDPSTFHSCVLDRISAAYKLKYGVADFFKQSLVANLRQTPFSLNIDEATASNNNKKVLSILVSYFNSVKQEIVIEHFASVELVKCDSASIFDAVKDLIETNEIPWTNLTSCLLDSCAVMRGSKSGFETRLRQIAPHLLDIDGDSCHHVHNACKKFCEPFEYWVERLFNDLYTDFKWSSESKALIRELCDILGVKFTAPERFISHRWLSCYDLATSTLRLYDMLRVFYSATEYDITLKKTINKFILNALGGKNEKAEKRVYDILHLVKEKSKTMTKEGKARKDRIKERLFEHNTKTRLVLNFYASVLPMLKNYVITFQKQEPLIHKLHDHQVSISKQFLACFIKAEKCDVSVKKLASLDVDSIENHLSLESCYVGKETNIILSHCTTKEKTNFLILMNKAYRFAAKHLLKVFPLNNSLIQNLSALDPTAPNHSVVTKCLQDLSQSFTHYLSPKEQDQVLVEIKNFTVRDQTQTTPTQNTRADVWWATQHTYPTLRKLALSCMTIFHGPEVERSFSSMKDIMKSKSANLHVSTFSAIQTVRYALKARNTNAVECFKRKDLIYTPVDSCLVKSIRNSAAKYKAYLLKQKELRLKKKESLDLELKQLQTKSNAKAIREKAVKHALKAHKKAMRNNSSKPEKPKKPPSKRQRRF